MTIPSHKGFWTGEGFGAITVQTYGFDELHRALQYLPGEMQQKCVEQALKHGGKEIVNQAKANIRSRSGALAKAISLRTNKKEGSNCLVQLGPFLKTMMYKGRMKQPFYGHMVEWNTKAHHIPKKRYFNAKRKPLLIAGKTFVWDVDHPGTTGQRPLTRAMDEKRTAFLFKFGDYIDKFITKHFQKFAPTITRGS
jgi:hypothetical protein